MNRINRYIIENPWLMVFIFIFTAVLGIYSWFNLTVDAFPDVTNQQVIILTEAPGFSPDEVERKITFVIENSLGGLKDVVSVRSLSQTGLSRVTVIFDDSIDTWFARNLVFQRISEITGELPENIIPRLGPVSTGLGEIYQYEIMAVWHCLNHKNQWSEKSGNCPECGSPYISPEQDLVSLRTLQDWIVNPGLKKVPGINEVNSFGGLVKEFHIIPDPEKMYLLKIGLDDLVSQVKKDNLNAPGSFILKDMEQVNVVSRGLTADIGDIENIVIQSKGGAPVLLKDIARVEKGFKTRYGAVSRDGRGEVVTGMTIMLKGGNSRKIVNLVKEQARRIEKSLPPDVKIRPFYDRTDLIEACVKTVSDSLFKGALLVTFILFFFMGRFRISMLLAMTLPLAAAFSFIMMKISGLSANLMSLGGIVISTGIVVDGPIIVLENIMRNIKKINPDTKNNSTVNSAILKGMNEVIRPVFFAVLIILLVFVPLFALENHEGKMFKPLAWTMIFSLAGSILIALVFIPAVSALFFGKYSLSSNNQYKKNNKENKRSIGDYTAFYFHFIHMKTLNLIFRFKWTFVIILVSFVIWSFNIGRDLGTDFLPPLNEGAIAVNIVRLPSANVKSSVDQSTVIEKRFLKEFPEIKTIVSKTGRPVIAEDPMGPEQTDMMIMLKNQKEWNRSNKSSKPRTQEAIVEKMSLMLKKIPGIRPAFSQPVALRVNELISGIKTDVAIKIFGDHMPVLLDFAGRIAPVIREINGASDVKIEQITGFSEIGITIDRNRAGKHLISPELINLYVNAGIGGMKVSTLYEGQKRFDIVIRYPKAKRDSIESIKKIKIKSPLGYFVDLENLARVEEKEVYAKINREDFKRRLIIECNVRSRDTGSFVKEAKEKILSIEKELPPGFYIDWGGQFENQERAMKRLTILVPLAVLIICLMLYAVLGNYKSTLIILINLPLSITGGIAALYLGGHTLTVSAFIGFIALFGVAVEDGLVLISFSDELRKTGLSVKRAVKSACRARMKPMLITSLTTLSGLLPMYLSSGAGAEIQKPLVGVIFGGMITCLVLEFIALPLFYMIFFKGKT
jgi:cobalt-zinc-cadmium resistance protein CzcA